MMIRSFVDLSAPFPMSRAARGAIVAAVLVLCDACTSSSGYAALIDLYQVRPEQAFDLAGPADRSAPPVFDVLADGRVIFIATVDGDTTPQNGSPAAANIYLESGVGTRVFGLVGELPLLGNDWNDFGGAFLRVSPSGDRIAVGNNSFANPAVAVFSPASLSGGGLATGTTWYQVDNFAAAWYDDETLVIANLAGVQSIAAPLQGAVTLTPTPATVISGIGASADVAFDAAGNLYTGVGFGDGVGQVRGFDSLAWQAAESTSTPLDFATGGDLVTTFASASTLRFDAEGNLIIGGGRSDLPFVQSNGFGVYSPGLNLLRVFDPNDLMNEDGNFYAVAYNRATGEIYAQEPFALAFGQPVDSFRMYVVQPIPEPSAGLLAATGLLAMAWTHRRLRRASA